MLESFFTWIFCIVPALICVAFFTHLERKVLGSMGLRVGPSKTSMLGILQPISDALKLMNKEVNYLSSSTLFIYYTSTISMIMSTAFMFSLFFSDPSPMSLKFSVLIFFLILGFSSFSSMLIGWCTFSKFSMIGSIRGISQLISYEAVIYLCLFFFFCLIFSFDFHMFEFYNIPFFILMPFCFYLWIPSVMAELHRSPFDFSEGESELVSGFNVETGSGGFTLIFLAEYGNIYFFCTLTSFLFFGNLLLGLFFSFFMIWIRAVLPRFRYDKLMSLCWEMIIPFLTLIFLLFILFLS